jgi:hypothetical protein
LSLAKANDFVVHEARVDFGKLCDLSKLQVLPNSDILVIFPALRGCSTL